MTTQSKQTDIFKTEFSEDDLDEIAFSCAFREGDIKEEIRDQRLRLRANSFGEKQQQEKFIRKLELELKAIEDWISGRRLLPTCGDPEILESFPMLEPKPPPLPATPTTKEKAPKPRQEIKTIPVPEGTLWWCQITLRFQDYERVKITVAEKEHDLKYDKLGFKDGRSEKPNSAWLFLYQMAASEGHPQESVKNISKKVSLLNKALKEIFPGIGEKPFKTYVKGIGWQPRLTLTLGKNLKDSLD